MKQAFYTWFQTQRHPTQIQFQGIWKFRRAKNNFSFLFIENLKKNNESQAFTSAKNAIRDSKPTEFRLTGK